MTFSGKDIDIERLIETRMLVSANSGGGKSYLLRNLLESTHGKVQQIVLDMEGEFGTLRESFDYVLIGKDGDLPTDVRSAGLLAKRLLELNTSAIINLYELQHHERIRYVKIFLDAMVNSPKELWHPVLVVLDEAHIFAPEKRESEAMSAVADMATRGRKRGFCLVAAIEERAYDEAPALLGKDIDMHKQFTIEGWKQRLPKCESAVFSWLMDNQGPHSKEEVGEATSYSASSGGFNNAISRLNSLGLIVRENGSICLNEKILEEYA